MRGKFRAKLIPSRWINPISLKPWLASWAQCSRTQTCRHTRYLAHRNIPRASPSGMIPQHRRRWPRHRIRRNNRYYNPSRTRKSTSALEVAVSPAALAVSNATSPVPSAIAVAKAVGIASIRHPRQPRPNRAHGHLPNRVCGHRHKEVTPPVSPSQKISVRLSPSSTKKSPIMPQEPRSAFRHPRPVRVNLGRNYTGHRVVSPCGNAA